MICENCGRELEKLPYRLSNKELIFYTSCNEKNSVSLSSLNPDIIKGIGLNGFEEVYNYFYNSLSNKIESVFLRDSWGNRILSKYGIEDKNAHIIDGEIYIHKDIEDNDSIN